MEFELTPKMAVRVFEGEGGEYYSWSSSEFPLLGDANVGGGKLVLRPGGFALPHYADSFKLAYVLHGNDGLVGMKLPKSREEKVVKLKKGDVISVPLGAISWWFNNGDTDCSILFLGSTPKSYIPGDLTYFILTGTQGLFGGFSTEFISKAYNMNNKEATEITKSQTGSLIIKLTKGTPMPQPQNDIKELVFNLDAALPDVSVKNGGIATTLTAAKFPILGQVELSAKRIKLDADAMYGPVFESDSTVQVVYVVEGSCRVQIVGINGQRALDNEVNAGYLFVVPKFYVVAIVAGGEGITLFSIITSTEPVEEGFTGKASVWNILSPQVLQVS